MALLTMQGIRKSFSGVPVLKGVDLTVERGEIHALLGENGAGKSTLMNILTGTIPYDEGTILFEGQSLQKLSVRKTEELGIAFVHQELNLFPDLKVFENLYIGRELTNRFGRLNKKEMMACAGRLFERLGVSIDPAAKVSDLRTGDKQLLEISKALLFRAKLLILDEPTTALSQEEVSHLFRIVKELSDKGIAFIFISHKMPEIFAYCDRYTVLRNGEFAGRGEIKDTNPVQITGLMVGHEADEGGVYKEREAGGEALRLTHFSGEGFQDVSLTARQGQVIGLTGLQGCGSSELLQCLFGVKKPSGGTCRVFGNEMKGGGIQSAMRAGIGLLPSNRKENSVIPDMNLLENFSLAEMTMHASLTRFPENTERLKYESYREKLHIHAKSGDAPVVSLSGGNQQKVFIARWLHTDAKLLLFDNPTQGIDVGAKEEIYRLILELAKEGRTILVNTLEIPELQKIADECVVFCEGRVAAVLPHDAIREHTVMMYATGSFDAGKLPL